LDLSIAVSGEETVQLDMDGRDAALLRKPVEPVRGMP
jgi:hypothetical protein